MTQATRWAAQDVGLWVAYSLAVALATARYAIQTQKHGSLLVEDWLHISALLQCLAFVITKHFISDNNFATILTQVSQNNSEIWGFSNANTCLFWTIIFTCKAVFLALYKRVFSVSRRFVYMWWLTVAVNIIAFLIGFLAPFFVCGGSISNFKYISTDNQCQDYGWYWARVAILAVVCNGVTDLLLMALPFTMLLRLQMRRIQKYKLAAVFLLALVTLAIDIAAWVTQAWPRRATVGVALRGLEPIIAVILASLPAFVQRPEKPEQRIPQIVLEEHRSSQRRLGVRDEFEILTSQETASLNQSISHVRA